jgi:molecular chaperone GrpE
MNSDMSDPSAPANDPGSPAGESVEARIAQLEADVARYKDQALRALAEAENTRRRTQREIEDHSKYANSNVARDMLPLADNLRRALETLTPEERAADEKLNRFAEGIELVERDFLSSLDRHNVKRVDPLGQPFDHNLHQAVAQVEVSDKPPGTVVQVMQPGYTIHGRLLRPAMVVVSKGAPANPGAGVDTTA